MSKQYQSSSGPVDPADQAPPRTTRHPFDRQAAISQRLRNRMFTGRLKPGDRLPSRQELVRLFKTTTVTVHKALSRLEREGFIQSRGWEGTFVAPHPPHLCRYGLVLPVMPEGDDARTHRFASTLAEVAGASVGERPRRIATYSNIRGESAKEEDLIRLHADLDHRCMAGLILTDRFTLMNKPVARLIERSGVPLVSLLRDPAPMGSVSIHLEPFWDRTADYFARRGRKRVGFVFINNAAEGQWIAAEKSMRQHGLDARLWWRIDADTRHHLPGIRPAIQMLLHLPPSDRPDALIICDDSVVPAVTAALSEAGGSETLDVVAHANFPMPTPAAFPVARIGYDAREILRTCLDTIDLIRQVGGPVDSPTIQARWQDQIQSPSIASFINAQPHGS